MVFSIFLLVSSALGDVLFHFGKTFGQTYVNHLEDKTKIAVNGNSVEPDECDATPTDRGAYFGNPCSRIVGFPNDVSSSYEDIDSSFSISMWHLNVIEGQSESLYRHLKNGVYIGITPRFNTIFVVYRTFVKQSQSVSYISSSDISNSKFYLENWVLITFILFSDSLSFYLNNILQGTIDIDYDSEVNGNYELLIGASPYYLDGPAVGAAFSFIWYYYEVYSFLGPQHLIESTNCFFQGCQPCENAFFDPVFEVFGCLSTQTDPFVNNKGVPCSNNCVNKNVGCLEDQCLGCSCSDDPYRRLDYLCDSSPCSVDLGYIQGSLNCFRCANYVDCIELDSPTCCPDPNSYEMGYECLCNTGYYKLERSKPPKICEKCPLGCESCILQSSSVWCTECSALYNLNNLHLCACPAGSYSKKSGGHLPYNCIPCSAGNYCPEGSSSQTPCPAGTYNEISGAENIGFCLTCTPGNYCPIGSPSQTLCPVGTYNQFPSGQNHTSCIPCPSGTYSQISGADSINSCIPCPAGTYNQFSGAQSVSFCLPCPAGTYNQFLGAQSIVSCLPCPPGTFNKNSGAQSISYCLPCPPGSYNQYSGARDSSFCLPCQEGTYNEFPAAQSISSCLPCQKGTFNEFPGAQNVSFCLPCPTGTYNLYPGARNISFCLPCPVGTYCPFLGAQSVDFCLACSAGRYCPSASTNEIKCPLGTFNLYTRKTSPSDCLDCPVGYFCVEGAVAPEACLPGTYRSSTKGASSNDCSICSPGSYCPNYATSSQIICPIGYYCPIGSKNPAICPTSTVGITPGLYSSSQCTACPIHCQACNIASCTECSVGFVLYNGGCFDPCTKRNSQFCIMCIEGYYLDTDKKCQLCGPGCLKCNANRCNICQDPLALSDGVCIACPSGCATCVSKSTCLTCLPGYFKNGNDCLECPTGCSECTSSTKCSGCNPPYMLSGSTCA